MNFTRPHRHRRAHDRLQRPPIKRVAFHRARALRPKRPLVDPRAQHTDLLRGERVALGRHLHIGIEARDEMDHRTLRAFAGHDIRRMLVTAVHGHVLPIHAPAPLLLLRPVAFLAARFHDRLDVLREIHRTRRRRRQLGKIQRLSPPSRRDHTLRDQQCEAPAAGGNREKHGARLHWPRLLFHPTCARWFPRTFP